jgi:adenylate cyclase class 2
MALLEVEVKFLIQDVARIRQRLLAAGGVSEGRCFESNIVFDDPEFRLRSQGLLLRLRRDREVRLTFKRPPAQTRGGFKVLEELEVTVGDFDSMRGILEALSYRVHLRYEKWRETFHLPGGMACVDTLPYGSFLELETGDADSLQSLAGALELPWDRRIVWNYHRIFLEIQSVYGLSFSDITFDRFEGLDIDLNALRHRFEEGSRD